MSRTAAPPVLDPTGLGRQHVELPLYDPCEGKHHLQIVKGIGIDPDQKSLQWCGWMGCEYDGSHGLVPSDLPLVVVFFRGLITALCPVHHQKLVGVTHP